MTQSPPDAPKTPRKSRAKPAAERPRVGGPRAIADLVPAIGEAAFRRFGFIQSSIVTRWEEIVGERLAAMSSPESIRFGRGAKAGGTLELVVASGLAPMVQHEAPEIIARVNRFFGYDAVAKVAIRQGQVRRAKPAGEPPPRMLRPVPADMGEGLRDIADPELRAVLEALAGGVAGGARPPRVS